MWPLRPTEVPSRPMSSRTAATIATIRRGRSTISWNTGVRTIAAGSGATTTAIGSADTRLAVVRRCPYPDARFARERGMKRLCMMLLVFGLACAGIQAPIGARAQDKYPSKPVKILVPYGPGGATDIVARIVGEHLRDLLGQAYYVENKPGGYGMIAIEDLARSKPDGYTLMVGNVSTNAITPILFKSKLKINYEQDVVPVLRLVDVPAFLLVTATNFAPRTVPELIEAIKKNPGRVR